MVAGLGRSAHLHTRQVDEHPTKRSETNNDKSAVAMLKKGNWARKRIRLKMFVTIRTGKPVNRDVKKLGQNSSKRQLSDARTIGLRISGHDAAEVYSPEEH